MSNLQTAIDISTRQSHTATRFSVEHAAALMIFHLHQEHDMGVRAIARSLGMKEKAVKAVLKRSES